MSTFPFSVLHPSAFFSLFNHKHVYLTFKSSKAQLHLGKSQDITPQNEPIPQIFTSDLPILVSISELSPVIADTGAATGGQLSNDLNTKRNIKRLLLTSRSLFVQELLLDTFSDLPFAKEFHLQFGCKKRKEN